MGIVADSWPIVPIVNAPMYTSTLPHVMVKPFNCKGGQLPHQKWYAVSIGWEPRIYVNPDESKERSTGSKEDASELSNLSKKLNSG